MIVDVVMPKMGESITEGTILEWRKKPGDRIEKDEILLEIGTDKVDSEIPSSHDGTVVEILTQPNETVDVGTAIARIDTTGDVAIHEAEKPEQEIHKHEPVLKAVKKEKPAGPESPGKTFYTPVVLKIAREQGIGLDLLESIEGSGRGGRITKKDILAAIESGILETGTPAKTRPSIQIPSLAGREVEMDHVRKKIAEHMRHSLDTSAHVYLSADVDMTRIMTFMKDHMDTFREREGFNLTVTPFIMAATVKALKAVPDMNASLDGSTIRYHRQINLGIAVAVENGLLVPSIPGSDELNFLGLCRKLRDIVVRAREKKIMPDELQGSTFSISNFGVFNVRVGFPIINQPNVGILGVGTIKKQPVIVESPEGDVIAVRNMGTLSLSFDHRLIDGAGGSRFIDLVRQNLENMDLEKLF